MAFTRARAQKARVPKHAWKCTDSANSPADRTSQANPWETSVNLCLTPRNPEAAKGSCYAARLKKATAPGTRGRDSRVHLNEGAPGVQQVPKGSVVVRVKELRKVFRTCEDRHRVKANAPGNAGDMLNTRDFNGNESCVNSLVEG